MFTPKLIIFYVSCLSGFIAGHMVNYSAVMYTLDVFDSSTLAGVAYGFCFGPPIIFGWVAGAYIDRYSAKRVLLLSQFLFMSGAAGFWVVMEQGSDGSIPLLLFSNFLVGVAWAFVAPARIASLAQFVSQQNLAQATIVFNLLVMVGFGLAPIFLVQVQAAFNWPWVMIVSLLMFVFSSLLLFTAPNNHQRLSHEKLLDEWKTCFSEIKQTPVIFQLLCAAIIGYILMGPMQVILPQVATELLQLNTLEKGRYLGLISLALLIGGILAMKIKNKVHVGHSISSLLVVTGVCIALVGQIENLWLNCFVLVFGITLAGIIVSFIVAGLQALAPGHVRGRIMSIYTIIGQVIAAIAGVVAGMLAQQISVPFSLMFTGALFIILAGLLFWKGEALRSFKQIV